MRSFLLPLLFCLIVSIPLTVPFLQTGYFSTHDGEWAIVRLAEMRREIKDLQIPPRWSGYLNHGYGYPLFHYTYPLPYYLGAILSFAGLGLTSTIKSLFVFSIVASGIGMFLLVRTIWNQSVAFLATTLFLYAPYRTLNLYVRGSLGESLSQALMPFLFLFSYQLIKKSTPFRFICLSLLFAMFTLTHNAMFVLFTPFLLVWAGFWLWHEKFLAKEVTLTGLCVLLGLGLGAFFWLPAIFEKSFIRLAVIPLADKTDHFLNSIRLFSWQVPSGQDLYFQIGIAQLAVIIVTLGIILFKSKKNDSFKIQVVPLVLLICSCLFLFSVSFPLWQLPIIREIDFPWRMLAVSSFLVSLLVGTWAWVPHRILLGLSFVPIIVMLPYITTSQHFVRPDEYYATNDATTTSADELLPRWVESNPSNRPVSLIREPGILDTSKTIFEKSNLIQIPIMPSAQGTVTLEKVYFPGWQATAVTEANQQQLLAIRPSEREGLIQVNVPQGAHLLVLQYRQTPIQKTANIISLVSLVSLGVVWIFLKKQSR